MGQRNDRQKLGTRYWRLWSAAASSSFGDGLVYVAFPLLAASVTRDPRLIAGVMFAERLPWLLVSLAAGALADRSDRLRFLVVVEAGRTAVMAALVRYPRQRQLTQQD